MHRRALLLGCTALGGCSLFGNTVAAWANDANTVAKSLAGIVSQVSSVTNIPANIAASIAAGLQSAADFAQQLAGITDPGSSTTLIQKVEDAVNAALQVATPYLQLLPQPIPMILSAVTVLLPIIEGEINPLLAGAAPAKAARAMRPGMTQMTPDQARVVLRGYVSAPRR